MRQACRCNEVPDMLFCYGTLGFPQVMRAVTGNDYPCRDAMLRGYARYRVRGEVFPGIVEESAAVVRGVLYQGLDEKTLHLIDVYENECYSRQLLDVEQVPGKAVRAWVYVVPFALRGRLSSRDWHPEFFARHRLGAWLRELGA